VNATSFDDAKLAALSRRLGIPARQLLIAAARLAEAPNGANDPAFRARVIADARSGTTDAESAARRLLTPLSDYALDEVDRLFAGIWPPSANGRSD
jgi:hypothetical protein